MKLDERISDANQTKVDIADGLLKTNMKLYFVSFKLCYASL